LSRTFWRIAAAVLVVLALSTPVYFVWKAFGSPDEAMMLRLGRGYFDQYGLVTVFVAAVIEGIVIVGWYFPGTTIMVLGLVLATPDIPRVLVVSLLCMAGLLTAYTFNFCAGKYGWYRLFVAFGLGGPLERAQQRITRHGSTAIFMTYWQIALASLTSTAAGVLQIPFGRFFAYSAAATVLWIALWSVLIYFLGRAAMTLVGLPFVLALIVAWVLVGFIASRVRRRSRPHSV
jgi:membrane-associated protein